MLKIKSRYFQLLFWVSISTILLSFPMSVGNAMEDNRPQGGIVYLDSHQDKEIVKLDGKWEFYWQQLYTPLDFGRDLFRQPPSIVEVPLTWRSYTIGGEKLPLAGYATYRLQIKFPEEEIGTVKALYIPSIASAYKLWINGEVKSQNGEVGKTKGTMKPENVPKVVEFPIHNNQIELIVQASNFNQRKAGIFNSILIGEPEPIRQYQQRKITYRAIIVTSLVMIGIYHILMFLYRRKETSLIYFGILCIVVAIRATILEEGLASQILFFLNWEIARKLEYLGATIGVLFFTLFVYTQFSKDMHRKIRDFITVVYASYSLFILFTPAVVYTRTMLFLQILILLAITYLLFVYSIAYFRKRENSLINALAIMMLFLSAINDTLYFNNVIYTTELASVGLVFFLFTQSIMISKRYSMAYLQSEKLSNDLAILNASLERQVLERTKELQYANKRLQVANESLEEAHQLRSKWIRNISHEISTPLTNIRAYTMGMLDGVIPSKKNFIQLVYDQSLYLSRMLHDLHDMTDVENRQIKYDLQKVNIQDYVLNFYNKTKLDVEKEGIIFKYHDLLSDTAEELIVFIDPLRIEQVIVNILKNAKRFVKEDGEIQLELGKWDEKYIIIKIKDNGIGIKEDELDLVFNRFYKSKNQNQQQNGSGLGLSISKEIIEHHHGMIGVESKEGEGSCFYFMLPLFEGM